MTSPNETAMDKTIRITTRFIGPPDSGNGGYTCGLVSQALGVPAEVTLRRPIPIERDLTIQVQRPQQFGSRATTGC